MTIAKKIYFSKAFRYRFLLDFAPTTELIFTSTFFYQAYLVC